MLRSRDKEGGRTRQGAGERSDSGEGDILSVSGEEDGVSRDGGGAVFGGYDFRRESASRFGAVP